MSFTSWLQNLRSALAPGRGQRQHGRRRSLRAATYRPNLEVLEDRCLLSFSPVASFPVGTNPQAIVSADFNGDGRIDLATANYDDNTVSVLLGNANGTFQPAQTSATGAYPQSLAVGDFNADGKLDLATANAGDVSVLLGDGAGNFAPPVSIALPPQFPLPVYWHGPLAQNPYSVATGDFNGDGKLDLGVTANVYTPAGYGPFGDYIDAHDEGYANVLLGTGTGSFAAPIASDIGNGYHTSVAAGDVNGDLKTDLVVANRYGGDVSVLLGNGGGGFAAAQNYAAGSGPSSVVLGDFNNDTKLDIATANAFGDNVSILRGVGNGTFSTAENFAAGLGTSALAVGDFNGDGWLDVATANAGDNTASVLINDQSWPFLPPSVSVSDATTVTEGNTGTVNATFTLTLLYASDVDVTVHYDTADISAAAGSDYMAASGDVLIPAGQTSRTFTVTVIGDRLGEPTETFAVNLSAPTNAAIGDGRGIGTILDDEPLISINDVTVTEGNNASVTATFTVTLSALSDVNVTVHYDTANGSATAGSDYTGASGDVIIPAGQTSQTFTVAVLGDHLVEPTETFIVNLTVPTNAAIGDGRGIGTILDNEPRISIYNVTQKEGNGKKTTRFTFLVTLSAASDQAVTMSYRTVDGTATTGDSDYIGKTGTLTFAPGETTKTITIEVKGDSKKEANETFYLDLFDSSINSLFTRNRGIGTILNDD